MDEITGVSIHPLTPELWQDFEKLFGPRGACGGCWCMFWKLDRKDFLLNRGEGNRQLQKTIVEAGDTPGLLAYVDDRPVGWCAIEPRERYPGLGRSRILKPVDETKVWSVSCFYVERKYRSRGLSIALLKSAVQFAATRGAQVVEGYPTEVVDKTMPAPFVYTGLASAFLQVGFTEVARRSAKRPIMRLFI